MFTPPFTLPIRALATGAILLLGLPAAAAAAPATTPSYGESMLRGTVMSFDGKYDLRVRDTSGAVDDVQLHQGTIIAPTGLTLAPGMRVTVYGTEQNGTLDANEIQTPYRFEQSPGYAVAPYYGGFGAWGPGFWGAPFAYGYAPVVIERSAVRSTEAHAGEKR